MITTSRELPNGRMYYSPIGLFPFQEEAVVEFMMRRDVLAIFDTGIGKTHLGMASAALAFEMDLIDLVVVAAEGNKVDEWVKDFQKFTTLIPILYHGASRKRRLETEHHVLVSTYETLRNDAAKFVKPPGKRGGSWQPGDLLPHFLGKRVMVVYDEATKLKNRGSNLYKAHQYMIKQMRKHGDARALGLTATPMDTSPEDIFNIARLLGRDWTMTVEEFERRYTKGKDGYGRYEWRYDRLHEFALELRQIKMRKSKFDPDVIAQFPKQIEESTQISMLPEHKEFYQVVEGLREVVSDDLRGALWTVRRMVAGYPEAILMTVRNAEERGSKAATIANMILDVVGEAGLKALPSSKAQRLVSDMEKIVLGQRSKVLVFSYFGPTILPLLARDLREKKIKVYLHSPPLSRAKMDEAKNAFRNDPEPCVLLSSDAGARGMNIPEATYVFHYDMPLTFSTYRQRADRNHRIDSTMPSVTSMSYILLDTVEVDIAETCMDRNEQTDVLLEDQNTVDDYVLAKGRRERLRI